MDPIQVYLNEIIEWNIFFLNEIDRMETAIITISHMNHWQEFLD